MTEVSVIIPCFNAARWISEALESVRTQLTSSTEVIVVDDGSTDESVQIVRRRFGFARVISTANQGASRARNLGTSLASGRFIQYLDADDILMPGKIAAQLQKLEEGGADVAYGDWQKLEPMGGGFVPGEIISRDIAGDPELELFGDFWCPPAAYLFRRSIVEKVGGWNERLPVIQDARFALDCALHGAKFVRVKGIMAQYRVRYGESLSRRDSVAFNRDIYRNALEVEAWWAQHGGISEDRRKALLRCLGYVARSCYEQDRATFEQCLRDLERLAPGYIPAQPWQLRTASRFLGYRRAEEIALCFRRLKRAIGTAGGVIHGRRKAAENSGSPVAPAEMSPVNARTGRAEKRPQGA